LQLKAEDVIGLPKFLLEDSQRQFNANQIRFLRAVQNVVLKNRRLEAADLYEELLDRFREDAVERWFTEEEVDELIEFTQSFAA